jgi:hypothetical protein
VRDQASDPYKTTGKITVLYISFFIFFITNWKTEDSDRDDFESAWQNRLTIIIVFRMTFRSTDLLPFLGRHCSGWLLVIQVWFDWIFRSRPRTDRVVGLNMGPWHGEEQKSWRESESVATRQIGFVTSKQTKPDASNADSHLHTHVCKSVVSRSTVTLVTS